MSIAGNQYFSGVKNTVVTKESLVNPLESFQVFDNLLTHAADAVVTAPELLQARDKTLLLDITAANDLDLGADTAANAKKLLSILGLTKAGQKCILSITGVGAAVPANPIDLKNTATSTSTNVKIDLRSSGVAGTKILARDTAQTGALPGAVAYVEVTATSVTDEAEEITFNILNQITYNA